MFIKKAPNSHGWVNPKTVEELWRDHFDYFYREYDDFCFPVTIHPDVAGHPHVLFMLERYVSPIFPHTPSFHPPHFPHRSQPSFPHFLPPIVSIDPKHYPVLRKKPHLPSPPTPRSSRLTKEKPNRIHFHQSGRPVGENGGHLRRLQIQTPSPQGRLVACC